MDIDSEKLRKLVDDQEKILGIFSHMLKQANHHGSSRARSRDGDKSGFFSDMKKDYDESRKASQKFDVAIAGAAGGVASSFKMLTKDVSGAIAAFQGIAKGLLGATIGGVLIGGLTSYTTGLIDTYKDLAEYGQTFSDGIFGMAKAALEGSMSLDEYARLTKKNSALMSQMGQGNGGLPMLTKRVRDSAMEFGQFGYTMEGMNDLVADYMETQRMQGRLEKFNSAEYVERMKGLAGETSALAVAYGKSRKEITDIAQAAMRSTTYLTAVGKMSVEDAKKLGPAFENALTIFAAQAGEAGKDLPQFLADTLAFDGRDFNTELGRTIARVMPNMVNKMGDLSAQIKANPDQAEQLTVEYMDAFKKSVEASMSQLNLMQEMGGENKAQADQILRIYQGLSKKTKEEQLEALRVAKERNKKMEPFNKALMNLHQMWSNFATSLIDRIFPLLEEPLKAIGQAFQQFQNAKGPDLIIDSLARIGSIFSNFVKRVVTPENMKILTDKVGEWLDGFSNFLNGMASTDGGAAAKEKDALTTRAGVGFIDALTMAKDAVVALATPVLWVKEKLNELGIGMKEALAIFVGYKALKGLFSVANFLRNVGRMSVSAKNVYVNGSGGFGGSRRGSHGREGGGGRRGFFGRMKGMLGFGAGVLGGEVAEMATDAMTDALGENDKAKAKAEGAAETAKPAPEGKVGEGGFFKNMFKGGAWGFAGKALGAVGAVVDGYDAVTRAKEAYEEYKKSGDGAQFTKSLVDNLLPKVTGWVGASIGAAGAGLLGLPSGPGAFATGAAGGMGGYAGGSWVGDKAAGGINKLVDWFTQPNSPAVMSETRQQEIQTTQASVIERLTNLERQAETDDPNAKKMLELLQALVDGMKDGTGINAAFLQKVADAVSAGTRRLGNTIQSQGR